MNTFFTVVLILLFNPLALAQQGPFGGKPSAPQNDRLAFERKIFAERYEKKIPTAMPVEKIKALGLAFAACDDKKMERAFLACEKTRCFKTGDISGMLIGSEFIIDGFNSLKNCEISYASKRYFADAAKLPALYAVLYKNFELVPDLEMTVGLNGFTSSAKVTHTVDGKTCGVELKFQSFDLDLLSSNLRPLKTGEDAKTFSATFKDNGVTYVPADPRLLSGFSRKTKLTAYEITKGSDVACAEKIKTLYEMEKAGLIQALPNPTPNE